MMFIYLFFKKIEDYANMLVQVTVDVTINLFFI